MKNALRRLLGSVLVLGLLWLALKDVAWAEVWGALSRLSLLQLAVLGAINLLVIVLFSVGWWLLLRSVGFQLSLGTLVRYRLAGFAVSYFTPGPQVGGEPLQAYLLHRNHGVPASTAAATTGLDRVLELIVNLLMLAGGAGLASRWNLLPSTGAAVGVTLIVVFGAGLALGLYLIGRGSRPVSWLLGRFPGRSERLRKLIETISRAETEVVAYCREHPIVVTAVMGTAAVNWSLILLEYWLGMRFLGLTLSGQQLVTAVTINRIAFLIPLPAGLGALEGSQVLAMTVLGLNPAIGVSEGLVIRARDLLTSLAGLWIGWRESQR